ncbi:MAG: adenylosuccinate lyase, partial [Selenomonadales bacterium]|nr:adenylosuccinate lyase [Selenomonadales bacterium]
MIDRYTHAEMKRVWSKQHEWETMLEIEVAACEAMAELGYIPRDAAMSIRENASFDLRRIEEIEKEVHHDLIAFLTAVAERVGDDSKYIHQGLTSSDIKDTALALLMKEAADIILRDLAALRASLRRRAAEHKYTPCIGRTHGIHAEVMTLGMKFALWMDETDRNIERITRARDTIAVGKLSGAVGTYAETD